MASVCKTQHFLIVIQVGLQLLVVFTYIYAVHAHCFSIKKFENVCQFYRCIVIIVITFAIHVIAMMYYDNDVKYFKLFGRDVILFFAKVVYCV